MPGLDKQEFTLFFNQHYKPVRNFIYYKTGDIGMADDISQESFSKIWEKRDTIRPETAKALLYTIAANLCYNQLQHKKVVLQFASGFKHQQVSASPEFELEMDEFHKKLTSAINRLNEKNRTVFLMNRIDGFTYNEIAETLELSVKAIEKRMKNALDELKKHIEFKI